MTDAETPRKRVVNREMLKSLRLSLIIVAILLTLYVVIKVLFFSPAGSVMPYDTSCNPDQVSETCTQ